MDQRLSGGETDQAKAGEYLKKLEANLDVYDTILGKQKYLAGDVCRQWSRYLICRSLICSQNVTLADLQHLPYGSMLFPAGHSDVLLKRPNVAR